MLYMVGEKFKSAGAREVYRRSREKGRMLPAGLNYVSSWMDLEFTRCFQLMETEDFTLFAKWTDRWQDLVEFEIIPVRTSTEAMLSSRRPCEINGARHMLSELGRTGDGACKYA